jgi:hypothetical protein
MIKILPTGARAVTAGEYSEHGDFMQGSFFALSEAFIAGATENIRIDKKMVW